MPTLVMTENNNISRPMVSDKYSKALIEIDVVHSKVHEGVSYTANYLEKALASNGYMRIHVKTGAKSAHALIEVESEGKVYFRTFSDSTVTVDGTGPGTGDADKLTLFNRCGCCSNGNKTQIFYTPTYSNIGLKRGNRIFPFGTGGTAVGGSAGSRIESIFAPNTSYILEIQNVSGQARDIGVVIDWYEVEND
jgi:hypothetical protein